MHYFLIAFLMFPLVVFGTRTDSCLQDTPSDDFLILYSANMESKTIFQSQHNNSDLDFCSFLADAILNEYNGKQHDSTSFCIQLTQDERQKFIQFLFNFYQDVNNERELDESHCFYSSQLDVYKFPYIDKTFIIHLKNETTPYNDLYFELSPADLTFLHSIWHGYASALNNSEISNEYYERKKTLLEHVSIFILCMDAREYFMREAYYKIN